ncbi:hypothetical protein C4569_00185 [Candidatus Parcubacteria bacterium]|nr:MAG: hypothetical protein C4569_00185 [Candidatus Parcubacteria bacterium]
MVKHFIIFFSGFAVIFLQSSFFNILKSPFNSVNLFLFFLILLLLNGNKANVVWGLFFTVIAELYSLLPSGVLTFCTILLFYFIRYISGKFLGDNYFFSLSALIFLSVIFYNLLLTAILSLLRVFIPSVMAADISADTFIYIFYEIISAFFLLLLFYPPYSLIRTRFKF